MVYKPMNADDFKPGTLFYCLITRPIFNSFKDAKDYYDGDTSIKNFSYLPATENDPAKVLFLAKKETEIFEKHSTWWIYFLHEEKTYWMRELENLLPEAFKKIES